ncbi:uncharacterized protein F4812DRAFT_132643 [Daldinia caldariorum]|uniref:uncharacterized protein n=1 Tax=Daldinia caldariorum TaxID=326644 RepID=UPI0020085339|nr:uncharacterized protein F4812DRAFT_132643 [Daldinia caldariorum]KAI1465114.1 hypothetical protein F4812DRAFT_132643 [Daldinia caldariorum]
MAEIMISHTTVFTVYTLGTSYEAVDVFTKPPGSTQFRFVTEFWNSFTSSSTTSSSTESSTSTTRSSNTPSSTSSSTSSSRASPSPIQTTQSVDLDNKAGLSTGAVAGIAIACALAGLILGVLAGALFFRRRKRQRSGNRSRGDEYDCQEKPLRSLISSTDRLQLDQFLLDPTPDAEIWTELRSLSELLQQHVENNYHNLSVSPNIEMLSAELARLGIGQSGTLSAGKLVSLAVSPRTRYSAIQHIIASVTFASVTLDRTSPLSLLPEPLSAFTSSIPATESFRGNPEAVDVAFTRWRQLSVFLLNPSRSERTPLVPSEDVSTRQAQRLAETLNAFLEPFVAGDRDDRYEQENHLREVIVECATFGYLLLSQPSEYQFRFDDGGNSNQITVFPGVDRISDEDGHRNPSLAQTIARPRIESV